MILNMDYFKEIYCYLPRAGPGDSASTCRALSLIDDLSESPRILDIGCGPGVQTLDLLRNSSGVVTALDLLPEMISRLEQSVKEAGFEDRVVPVQADMNDMKFEPESFDLIWSEGSIYLMGFQNGLDKIKPLLKPGGYVAVSEVVWLKPDPPAEVAKLWKEYPEIDTVENKLKVISDLEYSLVDYFILPLSSWTDHYYNPLEKRIEEYKVKWNGDSKGKVVLEEAQNEISVFKQNSDYYSYAFFVMKK